MLTKIRNYFTLFEKILWLSSMLFIVGAFILFDGQNYLTLTASLVGVTALIFCAKGNPIGQFLMVIFGSIYGYISWTFAYYGEMITYMGMTVPMAVIALISWLRNPYKGNKAQVKINKVGRNEIYLALGLSVVVTFIFYYILKTFGTANLLPSTLSVTTSFVAVYLCYRRSPYFALAYAINDIVLIVLWVLAALTDVSYLSVIICFIVFLANDLYSFTNWLRMEKNQAE